MQRMDGGKKEVELELMLRNGEWGTWEGYVIGPSLLNCFVSLVLPLNP